MTDTLSRRLLDIVGRRGPHTAFMAKRDGAWRSFSFLWARDRVSATAFGLLALGLARGTRVAILSDNRPEWPIAASRTRP